MINADDKLRELFLLPQIPFPQLNDLLSPHLLTPDPIVIEYSVRVDQERALGVAYDLEVEIDDPIRTKMVGWVTHHGHQRDMLTLDQQVGTYVWFLIT